MAITAGGISPGNQGISGSGDFTVSLPTGWSAGQLALLITYSDGATTTISVSAGWTQVSGSPWGANNKVTAWWRVLQTGDGDPIVTIANSVAPNASSGGIATYNGVDTSSPIDVVGSASEGTGSPVTAGGVNTVTDGAWALGLAGRGDNEEFTTETFGGSATGVTERADWASGWGGDSELLIYDKEYASAGATGDGSADTSITDPWISVIIALKPASGGAWEPKPAMLLLF